MIFFIVSRIVGENSELLKINIVKAVNVEAKINIRMIDRLFKMSEIVTGTIL